MTITRIRQGRVRTEGTSIDDTLTPSDHDSNATNLKDTIDHIASQLADITGESNWYDSPDTTLSSIAAGFKTNIRTTLSFDSTSPVSIGSMPLNGRPFLVIINVTTAFDGSSESTLSVGDSVEIARLATTSDIDLHTIGIYEIACNYNYPGITNILGTYNRDSATVGAATIEVVYTLP